MPDNNCLTDTLANDIVVDCDNLTISGIEADVVLIPWGDVDKTASTLDAENSLLVTDLVLKPGKVGYLLQGIKQTNSYNSEFVKGDRQTLDKFRHSIGGRILTPSAANRLEANKLAKGDSYIAVVNKKYKGADSGDAFLVLGWDAGMELATMTEGSLDNDAAIMIGLANVDEMLEKDSPRVLRMAGGYTATLTAFNNKFVAEPET